MTGPSADGRPRFVKLVRDRVARFLSEYDNGAEYRPVDDRDEAVKALRAKLIEEAAEYLLDPSLGELADVWEVVAALAWHDLGVTMIDVRGEADAKREERGGFDDLIGMYVTTTAPARHEGQRREES